MTKDEAVAALEGLQEVSRIAVARLQPNDVIVIECDETISAETGHRLSEIVKECWPGHKVVVLTKGLHLKILGESETAA